jgi:D-glycero-alpha-D-manno-heptose-7-phosphate kinase
MATMLPSRTITAAAPIRICDNGGWTDTEAARHGKVFNIAVRPLVHVRLDVFPRGTRDDRLVINAGNYATRYAVPAADHGLWGPHPLIEAALRAARPPDDADVEVTVRATAPAGASTGSSAAVTVALMGALNRVRDARRSVLQIASDAHEVETRWLGRHSGIQDQLCSAHGGVNFIEITDYPHARVTALPLPDALRHELDRRLVLIYLGRPHSSSAVHEEVVKTLQRLGPECRPLQTLRQAAESARDAFVAGDLGALGTAMQRNTDAQAALHPALVHPDASRIIEIAAAHGAIGWKVNGAGGDGGSVTVLCDSRPGARRAMIRAIAQESSGFVPIPHVISRRGLQVS